MKNFKLLKIAFIAIVLNVALFMNSAISQTTPTILIDGVAVMANNITITPFWLNATQTLSIGNLTKFISVLQYNIAPAQGGGNSLQFESIVKVTTQQAVPTGKAWKVESVALDPTASATIGDNLGNHVATTDLNMNSNKVINMANPVNSNDAVNATTVQKGNLIYAADGGSANDYSVTLSPAPTAYTTGMMLSFKATNANNGASTLNINGLGTKTIKKQVNVDLVANDIKASQCLSVMYDGTNFQLLSPPSAGVTGVPSGSIMMWSGSIASVPSGWALCDGNNGTPNLQDKFIVGAGSTYTVGATGGEATHVLTLAEMPSHNHALTGQTNGGGSNVCVVSVNHDCTGSSSTWATTGSTGSGTAHENRPPYYAMAYIMKL